MSDDSNRFDWLVTFLHDMYARRAQDSDRMGESTSGRPDAVSGIIYVPYRSDCDRLAASLRSNNIGAAGLNTNERTECQRKWLENAEGYDIIVATTAFGMGIDKSDVRFVIHWTLPKSFEGYYQEAGRAGRDGKAALCMLFYSREDRNRVGYRVGQRVSNGEDEAASRKHEEKLRARALSFQELVKYCEQTERCRHVVIGQFFGEGEVKVCDKACDFCFSVPGEPNLRRRIEVGLSSEEGVSTQGERSDFYEDEFE